MTSAKKAARPPANQPAFDLRSFLDTADRDQLFQLQRERLARALLLLARYGEDEQPHGVLPLVSQTTLAEMIGTTRSRVNFFLNKFRKLGFIKYNGGRQINTSLLSTVLHD